MKRYRQQMLVPEIGIKGQEEISNSGVLIVGAGGLGTVVSAYLAAMGVGTIGIVDFDAVEETNLHRQFLYTPQDIGQNKAEMLGGKLRIQNDAVEIKAFNSRIESLDFEEVSSVYSVICDCTDTVETRIGLDEKCAEYDLPLIHGALSGWEGYITVFHHKRKFRYSGLFEKETLFSSQSCTQNGIVSPVCGIIGSYMANEAVKIITDIESDLEGTLLYVNALNNISKYIRLKKG